MKRRRLLSHTLTTPAIWPKAAIARCKNALMARAMSSSVLQTMEHSGLRGLVVPAFRLGASGASCAMKPPHV